MASKSARFGEIVDRKNTNSVKWDACKRVFGRGDILPMWVADSDWPAPEVVINALRKRVEHGVFGYTEAGAEMDEIVLRWVKKRYNWEIKKEWLVYISGVVPALNVALKALSGPGGKIVVQPPVYYPFFSAVKNSGARLIENQLLYEAGHYRMDLDDLENLLEEEKSNVDGKNDTNDGIAEKESLHNILVLCSPHNPVGRVWKKDELEKLARICLKHNMYIVSDEIHADLIYSKYRHIPIASISEEISRRTLTMIAPSKTFNLAGLKAAVTIIPDKEVRQNFKKVMEGLLGGSNIMGYTAMKAAYSEGEPWLEEQIKYLEENRDFTIKYLEDNLSGKVKALKPEGTYLIWLDCQGLNMKEKELEKFMVEKARVGLDAGYWFGSGGESFMRLNIACPRSILEEGLNRINRAVKC